MPWKSIGAVPANIKKHQGTPLTLEQANKWASIFDALKDQEGIGSPAAVAWATWSRIYKKSEDGKSWVKREKSLSLSIGRDISKTVVLQGSAVQSLLDKHKPDGEDRAWLVFRKREGKDIGGWHADELLLIETPTDEILKDILWEGEFRLFEVNPSIGEAIGHAIIDELPSGGIGFRIDHEKIITPITELQEKFDCKCLACGHKVLSEEHCQDFSCPECGGEMRRVERPGVGYQDFKPPEAGDAPQEVKDILAKVYTSCRERWAKAHPDDIENSANKESCSKIAWHAVGQAGWKKDAEGKWVKGTASSLSEVSCEIIDCPTCEDDKMFNYVPLLEQLSEEDAERTGETELLTIDGLAIAEGVWKGTKFGADVLKEGLERMSNKRIDVEHEDETWDDVKGFNYKPRWNENENGIQIQGVIFDERVLDWYKRNPGIKIGLSVKMSPEAKFDIIDGQKTCTYFDIKGIALTLNPACKVCWINSAGLVQLSSLDNKSDGGIVMAENKTPEELAAEKKLADEKKLAEDKKTEEAKVLAEKKLKDEKDKKLADDKAKKDKLDKEKEDAATAKLAAANSTLSPEIEKRFSDMQTELDTLKQANETLTDERSLSDATVLVDGLIESGKLTEAKRQDTTKVLMALSSNEDKAAFLSTIDGQDWEAGEKGLVLSEDDKDKDKDKDLEFSEPDRTIIT